MEMRMLCTYCMRLFSMISWLLIGCFDLAPGCAMITYPVGFYVFFCQRSHLLVVLRHRTRHFVLLRTQRAPHVSFCVKKTQNPHPSNYTSPAPPLATAPRSHPPATRTPPPSGRAAGSSRRTPLHHTPWTAPPGSTASTVTRFASVCVTCVPDGVSVSRNASSVTSATSDSKSFFPICDSICDGVSVGISVGISDGIFDDISNAISVSAGTGAELLARKVSSSGFLSACEASSERLRDC